MSHFVYVYVFFSYWAPAGALAMYVSPCDGVGYEWGVSCGAYSVGYPLKGAPPSLKQIFTIEIIFKTNIHFLLI